MISRRAILLTGIVFYVFCFSILSPILGDNKNYSLEDLNSFFEQGKHLHEEGENNLKNLENDCINQWPDIASRSAELLKIHIGKYSSSFKDIGQYGMESSKKYYFIHYFQQFKTALIYCGENTWDTFLLINPSGNIEMPGMPIFSKNGNRAFSYLSCEMNGDRFTIVKFENDQIFEELTLNDEDFVGYGGFSTPRWLSDSSIEILSKIGQFDAGSNQIFKKVLLNFDNVANKWQKDICSESVKTETDN